MQQEQEFQGIQIDQDQADIEMTSTPNLKRVLREKEATDSRSGRGKGKGTGFQIRVIGRRHDEDASEILVHVTTEMTLAQLKAVLPISNEYQFEPGFYRGPQEVMSEQLTMQEMNMESGSTLIVFFPLP